MISTYIGYNVYARNIQQTTLRVAAEPTVARDQAYYNANIGKVKTVDDFLGNYRLLTYATKAYGLQDLGNAKGLLKKVLESDLSDPQSFANRQNDSRYRTFARAFNFTSTGSIASSAPLQTNSQQQDLLTKLNPSQSAVAGLETALGKITSVASFEGNAGLYSQVLSAYGIDPKTSKSEVTAALESNLSDPNSVANRPGNGALRALAEDFNFAADGSIGEQRLLQSPQLTAATQTAYLNAAPHDAESQAAATTESAYYAKTIPELTSVDQLVSNSRLAAYVKTAFGLDPHTTTDRLRAVLTSNLLDPKSAANTPTVAPKTPPTTATADQRLASAFNIGTDGKAWDHGSALSAANLTAATTAYTSAVATDKAATNAAPKETAYFTSAAQGLSSVDALLADTRLVAYVKTAFGLPNATTSDLGAILKSNLLDPKSVANATGAGARKLAAAFNFAPNGLVYAQRPIQSAANVTATTTAYQNQAQTNGKSTATAQAAAQTETDYYASSVSRLKSVDDLLADKRLVAYVSAANGLPATETSKLRQVLTSNLSDPKSVANKLGGGYQTLATSFDISTDGSITHVANAPVQTKAGLLATNNAYIEQALETEAGDQNDGVRLALYFRAKAPTITSAYAILADKALTKVVQTALGLSSSSSKADIDTQARTITKKLNLADLKNPQKLDKFVARFAALYDVQNASDSSSSSISLLF